MVTRREKEIEAMKDLILATAEKIVAREGFESISIRKIAKEIEYSPSIIYHYFKDKEELLNAVMRRGYMKIVSAVSIPDAKSLLPQEKLRIITKNYIEAALKMPDEFLAAQLNQSPQALKHTSYLYKGSSKEKPALRELYNCIKEMHQDLDEEKVELKAQITAASTMGLILKLIVEKNIDQEQRERIINGFIEEVVLRI